MILGYIEKSELSSRGKDYPVEKVEIKGLTNDEICLIAMTDFSNLENVLETLIKNNKIVTNVPYNSIYDFDKYIIFYKIRELTFTTADYKISYECPKCGEVSDFILNTSEDLSINYWDGKFIEIPIIRNGQEIFKLEIRPSKMGDRTAKHLIQGFDNVNEGKCNLATSINNLGLQEAYEWICGDTHDTLGVLQPLELAKIISAYSKVNSYGFKPFVNTKVCTKCGGDVINIPFQMGFIDYIPSL